MARDQWLPLTLDLHGAVHGKSYMWDKISCVPVLRINWCGSRAVCYVCCSPALSGRWCFILGPLLWATVHRCIGWWAQRCHPAFVGVTLYSDSEMLPGFCNLAAKEWFRLALFFLRIKLNQVPALFHWWCEIKPVIRLFFSFFFNAVVVQLGLACIFHQDLCCDTFILLPTLSVCECRYFWSQWRFWSA